MVIDNPEDSILLAADGSHILAQFEDDSTSWTLCYNLFADRLLQLGVVDDTVRIQLLYHLVGT